MGKITNIDKTWFLEGTLKDGQPWIIQIDKSPFIIGRRDDCNFSILSKSISRRHAEIFRTGSFLMIQDLKSTNGTFVNEERIKTAVKLNNGDKIYFADMKFKIILKENNDIMSSGTFLIDRPKKSNDFITYYNITKREEEILYYLMEGKSTKKIADILFISEGTAKNHILNIFKKVNVHSRFELLALFNNFQGNK